MFKKYKFVGRYVQNNEHESMPQNARKIILYAYNKTDALEEAARVLGTPLTVYWDLIEEVRE